MRSHGIKLEILRNDDFEIFFQVRAKALMELIGKAMGKNLSLELVEDTDGDLCNGNSYRLDPEIITKY